MLNDQHTDNHNFATIQHVAASVVPSAFEVPTYVEEVARAHYVLGLYDGLRGAIDSSVRAPTSEEAATLEAMLVTVREITARVTAAEHALADRGAVTVQ